LGHTRSWRPSGSSAAISSGTAAIASLRRSEYCSGQVGLVCYLCSRSGPKKLLTGFRSRL
jgi:hypothetical protein